jgi:uncharacterized repeat protein (TIGR03803 family)
LIGFSLQASRAQNETESDSRRIIVEMRAQMNDKLFTFLLLLVIAVASHAQVTYGAFYSFGSTSVDPLHPSASGIIAQGRDGAFVTTAPYGGLNSEGAVFKSAKPNGGGFTVLHNFSGIDGEHPFGGVTLGADGDFYGTTQAGGSSGSGTVFKISTDGSLTTLYNFTGGSDGGSPYAPPIEGRNGNFFGTTFGGGTHGDGTIYEITPSGQIATIYNFDGAHGCQPYGPLDLGTDGNFYGTTTSCGNKFGGTVFKITGKGHLTTLHDFSNGSMNGLFAPYAGLVQGNDGNFYGTTFGSSDTTGGSVFQITPSGMVTVLHTFAGTDGSAPLGGLVASANSGWLYGTTEFGGSGNFGVIFKIAYPSGGDFSVLHEFDETFGADPEVTLLQHTNGILYGDTNLGGGGTLCACGALYYLNDANLHPFVTALPYSGKVGQTVELLGQHFSSKDRITTVSFNGTVATPTVKKATYLTVIVPSGATTGFVTVTTTQGTLTSNRAFQVLP